MPRFFFHRTDGFVEHDKEGTELADVDAARLQAIIFAGESLRDNPNYVWGGQEFRVEVTDEDGRLLLTFIASAIDADSPAKSLDRALD